MTVRSTPELLGQRELGARLLARRRHEHLVAARAPGQARDLLLRHPQVGARDPAERPAEVGLDALRSGHGLTIRDLTTPFC